MKHRICVFTEGVFLANYYAVEVVTRTDECGQILPEVILWDGDCSFPVERILHVCQPEDMIIRYTVKVAGKQRHLYFNGSEWRISNPVC